MDTDIMKDALAEYNRHKLDEYSQLGYLFRNEQEITALIEEVN